MRFAHRIDAGRRLAQQLTHYANEPTIVLGLPRGGVLVAAEVAEALGAPLDVWVVRKVGLPEYPETGMGAVAEGGFVYLDPKIIDAAGVSAKVVEEEVATKLKDVARRVALFRGNTKVPALEGKTVILVDDGIATGGTVKAAIAAIRRLAPGRIVLATPVAASQALESLRLEVDDVVCVWATPKLRAVGAFYDDFDQVTDAEVVQLLARARERFKRVRAEVVREEVGIAVNGSSPARSSLT